MYIYIYIKVSYVSPYLWPVDLSHPRGHCTGRGSQNQSDLAAAVSPLVRPSGALRAGQIHPCLFVLFQICGGFHDFEHRKNTISLASYIPINHNKSSRTHYHQLSPTIS